MGDLSDLGDLGDLCDLNNMEDLGKLEDPQNVHDTNHACLKSAREHENRSRAIKEVRTRRDLEIQRGVAKRLVTIRKRALKRASIKDDEMRRKYDAACASQDKYNAKSGRSKTLCRLLNQRN